MGSRVLGGQSTRHGQGISMMEWSVPTAELIHLSWVRSKLLWHEDTIIKYLQLKGYLKSIETEGHTDRWWWVTVAHSYLAGVRVQERIQLNTPKYYLA